MSNEPLFSEPPSAPEPQAAAGPARSIEAAMVLAALDRMEAAIRGERIAFERLRAELAEMAGAIARARSAMPAAAIKPDAAPDGKSDPLAALLHELDGRINVMMAIVGGAAPAARAAEPRTAEAMFVAPAASEPQPAGGDSAHAPDAAEPPATPVAPDRVPTVSGVVSRLGRTGDALMPETDLAAPASAPADEDVPSVSMLGALVEALSAPRPGPGAEIAAPAVETAPEPEPMLQEPMLQEPTLHDSVAHEPVAHEPVAQQAEFAAHEPLAPEASPPEPMWHEPTSRETMWHEPMPREPAPHEPAPHEPMLQQFIAQELAPSPAAETPTGAAPPDPVMPEVDLLSNFARMEAVPMLPPEMGTAVIFALKPGTADEPPPMVDEPPAPAAAQEPAPLPEPAIEPVVIAETVVTAESAFVAEPRVAPDIEPMAIAPREHDHAVVAAAPEPAPSPPEAEAAPSEAMAAAPDATAPAPEPEPPEILRDAAPEAESDPAAFLLEPAPPPQQPEQTAEAPPAPADDEEPAAFLLEPPPVELPSPAGAPSQAAATPPPVRYDPLAPLKAMSPEEQIALFS